MNETWLEFEIAGVKVAIAKKIKVRVFLFTGFVPTSWAPCCETWLEFEIKALHYRKEKKKS